MKNSLLFILTMSVFILFSCQEQNKKSGSTATADIPEREKDITLLKEFWSKENQSIKDENGFAINYRVESKNSVPVLLGVSDTLSNLLNGRYESIQYLELLLQKKTYSLFLDGEKIKDIDILYQVYQVFNARSKLYDNPYAHTPLYYAPELDPIEKRNEIIKKITINWVSPSTQPLEQVNRIDEEAVKIVKKAIDKTEIFKYKTLKDI